MRSRVFILVAAVVLGIAAALLTAQYLRGATARLTKEAQPVQVLVATQDVPRGTSAEDALKQGLISVQEVPQRYVSASAVSSARGIEGQVLATSLSAGEQVTRARFQFPSEAGLSFAIPDGFVAVSIPADDITCVGGMLKAGDWVLVTATFDPGPNGKDAESRILLQKARILAVGADTGAGAATDEGTTKSGSALAAGTRGANAAKAATVTLALKPEDVERIVFAEEQGTVWLALLPTTETQVPGTTGRNIKTIFK
ncbi:MAG: Flp pilus assembly protein CpaB [Actinobacteria bacterium]|nr:MAG: Flp pilus assembly protein CpaB [Actinomycetota bacterium]